MPRGSPTPRRPPRIATVARLLGTAAGVVAAVSCSSCSSILGLEPGERALRDDASSANGAETGLDGAPQSDVLLGDALADAPPDVTTPDTALDADAPDAAEPPADAPLADCPVDMVAIGGGELALGETARLAKIAPFCLDRTEGTASSYRACVIAGKCTAPPAIDLRCTYRVALKENHPINCITWAQAASFCASKGRRLASEEEWEWAARGEERASTWPWGNTAPTDAQLCWSGGHERSTTCPVASFPDSDSAAGIHDLAGNVYEWTSTASSATSPDLRIAKGGSFRETDPGRLTASFRAPFTATRGYTNAGVRCAKSR